MRFSPALHEQLVVTDEALTFLVRLDEKETRRPELYHSLRGQWQTLPFEKVSDASLLVVGSSAGLWHAIVRPQNEGEYTFRLNDGNGQIEWLGTPGSNGQVRLERQDALVSSAVDTKVIRHALGTEKEALFELEGCDDGFATALVLERAKDSWLTPRLVSSTRQVRDDVDTLLFLQLSSDRQRVTALLPLCTLECGTALRRRGDRLALHCQRDLGEGNVHGLAISGEAPAARVHELIEQMVQAGRDEVAKANKMPFKAKHTRHRRKGIRYCTYNALGDWFSGEQAAEVIRQLCNADTLTGRAIDSFLLDDGWQDIVSLQDGELRRLNSFGAHKGFMPLSNAAPEKPKQPGDSGFSSPSHDMHTLDEESQALEQLAHAVKLVRKQLPWPDSPVGVWLALEGYWDGCSPGGPIAARFGPLVEYQHGEHAQPGISKDTWHLPRPADFDKFWRSYFSDLQEAGIDYVKVDNQAWIDYALDAELRVRMSHSMTAAAKHVWGTDEAVTHCMAMTARTMTGALGLGLLTDVEPNFRNSDDFFPDAADSHRWHIACNATNTILTRHLSLTPDFDMFQTKHDFSLFHAVLRTFSPSQILITDSPKTHDARVLRPLLASRKNGRLAVVQSAGEKPFPLFPFEDVVHGRKALKLGLVSAGGASLGLFNCLENGDEALDTIEMVDFAHLFGSSWPPRGGASYCVYHQQSQNATLVDEAELSEEGRALAVLALPPKAAQVVAIAPMHKLSRQVSIGCVGLVDKLNPLVAVRHVELGPPASKTVSRSFTPLSMQAVEAPSARELFSTLRDRLLDPALRTRVRASPRRTIADEISYFIQAIFTFATLVAVHLVSVAFSRSPTAIAPVFMPLMSEKLAYEEGQEKATVIASLRIQLDLAGQLGFMCSESSMRDQLSFAIDGIRVPSSLLTLKGETMLELDMIEAIAALNTSAHGEMWEIEVSLTPEK